MITSERQLNITKLKIEDLKTSLKKKPNEKMNAILLKSARVQAEAVIAELQEQVSEYERLRSHGIPAIQVKTPMDLLLLPIRYRIAKQMSQEAFSQLVGVGLRQIARYEAEGYENIQGDTLKRILERLPLDLLHAKLRENKLG
jgi:hypothetical protein